MSATADLLKAYEEWRRFTEAETVALDRSDWPLVASCQGAKEQLQARILELTEKVSQEPHSPTEKEAVQAQIQTTLAHLIAIESSNAELLSRRVRASQNRSAELQVATRNLGRVQRSYGASHPRGSRAYC